MESIDREIRYYRRSNGTKPFFESFEEVKDPEAKAAIRERLTRIKLGSFGKYKPVGGGVNELLFDIGPGYRFYFGFDGVPVVIMLNGGDKKSQDRDIRLAKEFWKDYQKRK